MAGLIANGLGLVLDMGMAGTFPRSVSIKLLC